MSSIRSSIEPVVKEVDVPAPPEVAFARFTAEIDSWWPKATHSVGQERCRSVSWEGPVGADLFEMTEDGARHVWGTFKTWDPPRGFSMSWHPGRDPSTAQHVEVTFEPRGESTRVTLTHGGFDSLGENGQETRDRYDGGWMGVLAILQSSWG